MKLFALSIVFFLVPFMEGSSLCCLSEDVAEEDRHACQTISSHPFITAVNGTSDLLLKESDFNCVNGSKHLHFTTYGHSSVEFVSPMPPQHHGTVFDEEEGYCLRLSSEDRALTFYCPVLTSKRPPGIRRIRKCCPFGQLVDRKAIGRCIAVENSTLKMQVERFTQTVPAESFTDLVVVEEDNPLHCDYDYNLYIPSLYMDHKFVVRRNDREEDESGRGRLYIPRAAYAAIRQSSEYCIDNFVNKSGQADLLAMMCLPKSFYIMRWLLHNVYSVINFISASLVFITLLVYLLLPPLRNNIQGCSMICFLACLVVMHLENGIFLAKKYEPHTWCLNRACVSGYFRLASSTWITVMGYNIWRQLKNVPTARRQKTSQLLTDFLWRSLYAWGVPLVFELAAHFYKQNNGCPTHLKRCWSCDSVSRNLAQTPNVVLVTGNLIFFIPSALKVYRSIGFLQRASIQGPSLSKMERSRIGTIFRLFVLMQFYTVPRVIQWFVDEDWAKPELLIVCASIFLMIGPCIFYSFMCRRETVDMIKDQLIVIFGRSSSPPFFWWPSQSGRSKSFSVTDTISSTIASSTYLGNSSFRHTAETETESTYL